jgi:hypothetical protein
MKTRLWIPVLSLALGAPLFGQTDFDAIAQLRQIQMIPPGSTVSAIPAAGEVAPITGKPYCAIGRTVDRSPDGVHVDRSESNRVCRDEQGRTRREANGGRIVSIIDPVAGLAYSLQTETRTAMKRTMPAAQSRNVGLLAANTAPISLRIINQNMKTLFDTAAKLGGINVLWDPEMIALEKGQFNIDLKNATLEQILNSIAAMTKSYWKPLNPSTIFVTDNASRLAPASTSQSMAPQMSLVEAAREQAKRISGGGRGASGNAANVVVDDLGTQVVNGVIAQGVRITSIIPTGAFGNDHDIKTIAERWVSEDLHVLVKSLLTDSRTGSTVYDLINISQTSPDPSLFQVPDGYTLQEGGRRGPGSAMPVPAGRR